MFFIGLLVGVAATVAFNRYAKERVVNKINGWIASWGP